MTEKQEKILKAALELFAEEGFAATSTSKVAKKAGVSEGLIFRHYKNKQGLLEAILMAGEKKINQVFGAVVMETNPKEVLRKMVKTLDTISSINEDYDFWKLQYKIKWELEVYGEHKMEPIERALISAFDKLGYDDPQAEARFFLIFMDGLAIRFYLQKSFDANQMIDLLRKKYDL